MAINGSSVQYNDVFLSDMILLTRGARLNAMKRFFKKNLNAAKPPEQSKGLGGNISYKAFAAYDLN